MSEIRGGQKATKLSEIQIETFETPWGSQFPNSNYLRKIDCSILQHLLLCEHHTFRHQNVNSKWAKYNPNIICNGIQPFLLTQLVLKDLMGPVDTNRLP